MITARAPLAAALGPVVLGLVAVGLAGLGVLVGPVPSAAAAASCPDLSGVLEGDGAVATGSEGCPGAGDDASADAGPGGGEDRGGNGNGNGGNDGAGAADARGTGGGGPGGPGGPGEAGGPGGADAPPPDPYEWARAPDCPGNAPGSGSEALCGGATRTCPEPGDIRYVTYQRPRGAAGDPWVPAGVACLSPAEAAVPPGGDEAADAAPVIVVTGEQFQRLPFAPATAMTQPPGGQVLINVPTAVHAVAAVQVLPDVVLGVPVAVRATPAAWSWDFGDGVGLGPVADPGAPWPAGPHAHAYLVPGRYVMVMSTTYTGEFSVAGGPWEPIEGTATVASPPQDVVAHSASSRLVADLLG